jgi:hypothetical protein
MALSRAGRPTACISPLGQIPWATIRLQQTDRSRHTPTRGCPNVTPCSTQTPSLSIIIPAYNEARRLPLCLERVIAYLDQRGRTYEVLVVDDGSHDQTAQAVESVAHRCPHMRLIRLTSNMGKGAAVRRGMQAARGTLSIVCGRGWGNTDRRTGSAGIGARWQERISPSDHGRWRPTIPAFTVRARWHRSLSWEHVSITSCSAWVFAISPTLNADSSCFVDRSLRTCFQSPVSTAMRSTWNCSTSRDSAATGLRKSRSIGSTSRARKSAPGATARHAARTPGHPEARRARTLYAVYDRTAPLSGSPYRTYDSPLGPLTDSRTWTAFLRILQVQPSNRICGGLNLAFPSNPPIAPLADHVGPVPQQHPESSILRRTITTLASA